MTPQQIKTIREALGLTQQQLADQIAATQVTVARWETGKSRPTGAYRKALTELELKVTESDLLGQIRDALRGRGLRVLPAKGRQRRSRKTKKTKQR